MRCNFKIIFFVLLISGFFGESFFGEESLTPAVLPNGDIGPLKEVIQKMNTLKRFKANVSVNEGEVFARGSLSYQDGNIHVKFNDGRVIAADKSSLIVYDPISKVAGKQDLDQEEPLTDMSWILKEFRATKIDVERREISMDANHAENALQEIRLGWTKDYYVKHISMRYKKKETWVTVALSDVTVVSNLSAGLFSWRPPAESRTVTNPLNKKN